MSLLNENEKIVGSERIALYYYISLKNIFFWYWQN